MARCYRMVKIINSKGMFAPGVKSVLNLETPREPICGFCMTSVGCRTQENASCHPKKVVQFGK
jgi:hypothetical protein